MAVLNERKTKVGGPSPPNPSARHWRTRPPSASSPHWASPVGLVAQEERPRPPPAPRREREPPRRRKVGVVTHELGHDPPRPPGTAAPPPSPTAHRGDAAPSGQRGAARGSPITARPRSVKLARLDGSEIGPDPRPRVRPRRGSASTASATANPVAAPPSHGAAGPISWIAPQSRPPSSARSSGASPRQPRFPHFAARGGCDIGHRAPQGTQSALRCPADDATEDDATADMDALYFSCGAVGS